MPDRVVRVGDLGTAVTAMCPSGAVALDGLRVDARAEVEAIPAGASVVVLRGDLTGYVVRRVGPDHPMPTLPNLGEEIVRPACARNSAEVRRVDARDEAERERGWRAAARNRAGLAIVLGAVGGAILDILLDPPPGRPESGALGGGLGLLTGACLTLPLGRAGRLFGWFTFAANAAVVAGFVGAGLGFWTQYDSRHVGWMSAGAVGGGLVGFWAGWFVATGSAIVFGGPDGA